MPNNPGRRPARWIVPLVIALALAVGLVAFLNRPKPAKEPAYDKITLAASTQRQTVSLAGTLHPREQSVATFAVPGEVSSVHVKLGDKVVAGQPLAAVTTTDLDNAVTLAQANVDTAQAQLEAAQDNDKATRAQVNAARAQTKAAQASLAQAKERRDKATLTAPIAGTVARIDYAVGDQVTGTTAGSLGSAGAAAGAAAAGAAGSLGTIGAGTASGTGITIVATDAWQLDATATAADLPSLKKGQAATVTPRGSAASVSGVVDTVGIVANSNAASGASFPVAIAITSRGVPLYSGASADALITVAQAPSVLAVPLVAVTTTDGHSTVLVDDGKAGAATPVTLGRRFDTAVEVTGGLKAGDVLLVPRAQAVAAPTTRGFGAPAASTSPTR